MNKVDAGKRESDSAFPPNTLVILEQIPGYCETADRTDWLNNQSYWPSFNIPSFPKIWERSGYEGMVEQQGNIWTWENAPRNIIFRRDEQTVKDVASAKLVMRQNDFQQDPLSRGNPSFAIASRFDLYTPSMKPASKAMAFGAIDSKMVTTAMFTAADAKAGRFQCDAIAGPTHESLPVFEFAGRWELHPHFSMPKRFDFSWETMEVAF
jgi:Phospholipase B